jgi:DNA-binding GntR family transcriptional regulator
MKKEKAALVLRSLKEQVYDYLRQQFQQHRLQPGATIPMDATARMLGVSRTPLRDALVQLEMEGFVTISPRRGIFVNALPLDEIREFYQVIGALESAALVDAFPRLGETGVGKMAALNRGMQQAIDADDFDLFYEKNLKFHDAFIAPCGNRHLVRIVGNLKKRLYDFPRQRQWIKEWEQASIAEHQRIVDLLVAGDPQAAALYLRDVHWSFAVQERYIRRYYGAQEAENEKISHRRAKNG